MASKKLTPWFPSGIRPARNGVYQTECGYQHWNGRFWGFFTVSKAYAQKFCGQKSVVQQTRWRGLASDPARQS